MQKLARLEGFFYNRSNIRDAYMEACKLVVRNGYREVGLLLGGDSYEYPIWYMLQGNVSRIENVCISEETNRYEDMSYEPECILVTEVFDDLIQVHGSGYKKATEQKNLNVYIRWDLYKVRAEDAE